MVGGWIVTLLGISSLGIGEVITLLLAILGAGWYAGRRVYGFIRRVNDLEDTVYGDDRDDFQQGTVQEIQETQSTVERVEEKIDSIMGNKED